MFNSLRAPTAVMTTGGDALIDFLAAEGIRHIFTVPGESFLAVLDAMHGDCLIRPITCRNEGGAAMMAEATGKLTGRPGVALVTRGPGAVNAVAGVYVAHQDATPMILCVGMPPRTMDGLPAFQAIDLEGLFGKISKLVMTVPSAELIEPILSHAFRVALSGCRGPVVIGLPEDVLDAPAPSERHAPLEFAPVPIDGSSLDKIRQALMGAERPLVIAGGSDWSNEAARGLEAFADRFDLPVVTSFRRQGHFDNRHRCYVGHAGFAMDASLAAGLKASDVVIALGADLGEITTNRFTLLRGVSPNLDIVYIGADAGSAECKTLATVYINASAALAASEVAKLPLPTRPPPWSTWRRDLRGAYEASIKPMVTPGRVKLETVISILSDMLPADAIVTNGAGNYAAFLHRYFIYKGYPTQLAPLSGSMGYGLPAAIAAKFVYPSRRVVALAGDGCLQMTSQELMTAVQFGLHIIIIVANNGILGTIRMHQERRFPGRVTATTLMAPDFVAWAKCCGAEAERVDSNAEFGPALRRALDASLPRVIEVALDAEAISPTETISTLRAGAAKKTTLNVSIIPIKNQ